MKNIKHIICLILSIGYITIAFAQQDGAKVIMASETISGDKAKGFSIIVGKPYLGARMTTGAFNKNLQFRFPWDIRYLYQTFNEESFEVSKGYYTDKVRIKWTVRNNLELITQFVVYRRELTDDPDQAYENLAALNPQKNMEYEDKYIQGGLIYEYKIKAEGIADSEIKYQTFITGKGFRSPTAVVTGKVSYKGSRPVKNVSVYANPTNGSFGTGSAVMVEANSQINVEYLKKEVSDKSMFQAWIKPSTPFTSNDDRYLDLFTLENKMRESAKNKTIKAKLRIGGTEDYLEVSIDGSLYKIYNYIPSGNINARGNDILIPVSQFNTTYTHITAVMQESEIPLLYINGRLMEESYVKSAHKTALEDNTNYVAPHFKIETPETQSSFGVENKTKWAHFSIGSQQTKSFLIEEVRVWNDVSERDLEENIYSDYKRYIKGDHTNLICYLKFDEGAGSEAYDRSYEGFSYNSNTAFYTKHNSEGNSILHWVSNSDELPTEDQLGFFGITNDKGNYTISAIPYGGTGGQFEITPILGVHEFEPNQQLIHLGAESTVVNNVDFTDTSSFTLRGKVYYDTREVFESFVEINSVGSDSPVFSGLTDGDEYVSGPGILDESYNYYKKNEIKYSKGEYWLNDADTPNDTSDDYLERYARIASEGVSVYVDGEIVLDANNIPVVTDNEGSFEIQVPIGNHYITVGKTGHVFSFSGRFPANSSELSEFFEDNDEPVIFVDTTRVSLVGKVVGGKVEADKVIGFGHEGLFTHKYVDGKGVEQTMTVSSFNNIGTANITLDYIPPGSIVTDYTRFSFKTHSESGEYRVSALPLDYIINQTNGISIPTNTSAKLLKANETLNLSAPVEQTIPVFINPENQAEETGMPYHFEKSFTYRSVPTLRVIEQTGESELILKDGTEVSTDGFEYLVYKQFNNYEIALSRFEPYYNYDNIPVSEYTVPLTDGNLNITNNLALDGSESTEVDDDDESVIKYKFRGGSPSTVAPFTKNISIKYVVNGVEYEAESYIKEAVLLGGQADGSHTFITAAPDVPDIILRDPPGSNSYATIESGESITFSTESSHTSAGGIDTQFRLLLGVTFSAGGGLAGPVIETENTNNISTGIGLSTSSTNGQSLTKTYTFSQSISTSTMTSTDYLGALSDLYIGQSKNYYYGSYDDINLRSESNGGENELEFKNTDGDTFYIGKQKAVYISEEPSDTFFVYSQKHIVENLIPELERFVESIDNGSLNEDDPNVLTKDEYLQQINLWKSTVRENERVKYAVKNDRSAYKSSLSNRVNSYITEVNDLIASENEEEKVALLGKVDTANRLKQAIAQNFEANISLDAGVGEVSRTIETSMVNSRTRNINLNLDQTFAVELGFNLNKFGLLNTTSSFMNQAFDKTLSEEEEKLTTISYVLSDDDFENLLSVDIINSFDGNGPVFTLIGGRSSCPYIGEELSVYYNNDTYDPNDQDIQELPEEDQESLSNATQQVEAPLISVEVAEVYNVPESSKAEFTLLLENRSLSESVAYLTLFVEPTSNPNNAIINISKKGIDYVEFPHGEVIKYELTLEKSISDIYDYEDIEIVFASTCDFTDVSSSVKISAHFVPSCTDVSVSAPLENWVYNVDSAYNADGSTNNLPIELTEYDLNFNNFQKIDLQYRSVSSPTWTRLHTYYSTPEHLESAISSNETGVSLIKDATINYSWDILEQKMPNGEYEIRAISTCTDGTDFISETIRGMIDTTDPVLFGTPSPEDGILGFGDDIGITFSENISYNQAVSLVEIKGETNQLSINNNVSLYFNKATAVINKPYINKGDFSLEFWMNNSTSSATATIIEQMGGVNIKLENNNIVFEFDQHTISGIISNDNLFHHYTFVYGSEDGELIIYEDGAVVSTTTIPENIDYQFTNQITIGGNDFIGNIHDLRLWSKRLSLTDAYANIYTQYRGNEPDLVGYWPMNEGNGTLAKDLSRHKHLEINNASWDIKPKGNSYEFDNNQYLTLDKVNFVNLTDQMDFTLSFWVKTGDTQNATLFSNGKGDGTVLNKWAINLNANGLLTFNSGGKTAPLTSSSITDNEWHHVAILMNRQGNLNTYVDADLVSSLPNDSSIKGFSSNRIWIGARGHSEKDPSSNEVKITIDRNFSGKLDEIRLWNTLRSVEQIKRDRYNEVDHNSTGLLLYSKMNEPDPITGDGPRYYHVTTNREVTNDLALTNNNSSVNYSDDTPPIKPKREMISFPIQQVINGDRMIFEPIVTSLASIEGQILDITVHRMFDSNAGNMQQSPITWTAFVNKNEVSWTIDGENTVLSTNLASGEQKIFEINIKNSGGKLQPFSITNIPSWLTLSKTEGILSPSSNMMITATVDEALASGYYEHDLFLVTDFGYNQKVQMQVDAVPLGPDWTVNPDDYDSSLNIIGKVKIDGVFSENPNNKIAAFINGEVRGVADVVYDKDYLSYYVFLTVYSNSTSSDDEISFSIWDSSSAIIHSALIGDEKTMKFVGNSILGTRGTPKIFKNSESIEQSLPLNNGWSWLSFYVKSDAFSDLNDLTKGLDLKNSDKIQSHLPATLDIYEGSSGSWHGSISDGSGSLSSNRMYKIKLTNKQSLRVKGAKVDLKNWNFDVKKNWNWLPYVVSRNTPINEALANFNPSDGDVIKSQNQFSIYETLTGWSGTLSYLEVGKGYMLKSSSDQTFSYPSYLDGSTAKIPSIRKEGSFINNNLNPIQENLHFIKYESNMNAVVQLPKGYSTLSVYDKEGTIRGIANKQLVNDKELYFITIYGESPEELELHLGSGKDSLKSTKTITFNRNDVLGTVKEPIIIEVLNHIIKIYPNPFKDDLGLELISKTDESIIVEVHNVLGKMMFKKQFFAQKGTNLYDISFDGSAGTYYIKIIMGDNVIIENLTKN